MVQISWPLTGMKSGESGTILFNLHKPKTSLEVPILKFA